MSNDPNVLSISVADEVGTVDIPPGGAHEPTPSLLDRFVPMHSTPGRTVVQDDLPRLIEEAEAMHRLCFTPSGLYPSAHAIAHTQIDDKDPLSFFVTVTGEIIINPKIVNHTKSTVDNREGCMTCPTEEPKIVQRYNSIEVLFQTVAKSEDGTQRLTDPQVKGFSGKIAKIIQHETAHCLGHCIYEDVISAEDCLDKPSAVD